MLLVNDFGCQYHAGEEASCSCRIFQIPADEDGPSHRRVFSLPQLEGETEDQAKDRYRGIDREKQDKLQAIEDGEGTTEEKYWAKSKIQNPNP